MKESVFDKANRTWSRFSTLGFGALSTAEDIVRKIRGLAGFYADADVEDPYEFDFASYNVDFDVDFGDEPAEYVPWDIAKAIDYLRQEIATGEPPSVRLAPDMNAVRTVVDEMARVREFGCIGSNEAARTLGVVLQNLKQFGETLPEQPTTANEDEPGS